MVHVSLCQMYFSSILQNKLPNDSGLHIVCVHPGVVKTNVVCHFYGLVVGFCNIQRNIFSICGSLFLLLGKDTAENDTKWV
jgi:hypothetical protein